MNIKNFLTALLFFFALVISAQTEQLKSCISKQVTLKTVTGNISGTLLIPPNTKSLIAALIIAGSGPTDRDGNNSMMKNNSLKMLAIKLCENKIASLRYDKRGVGESKISGMKEVNLRFEDYVNDAEGWIDYLKSGKKFNQIIVIGHSEGSLIGMIASRNKSADKFISIAGAGRSADLILKEQLAGQPPAVKETAYSIIDKLKTGKTVDNVDPMFNPLFRLSVQPYIISWFKYDPQTEIKKLNIPILIIQGTTDIQVGIDDAKMLFDVSDNAELEIIQGMNHILKKAPIDREKNIITYSDPDIPISKELINVIVNFINR